MVRLSTALDEAVEASGAPAAELITGIGDEAAQHRCWPDDRACGAVYDLASVTKPVTALAVLALGIPLEASARSLLPAFKRREAITVRQLLEHTSRLRPVVAVVDLPQQRPDAVLARIVKSRLRDGPTYSDLNFIVAGRIVEAVSHRSLEAVLREHVFGPLKMSSPTWHAATPHDPLARVCVTPKSEPGHAGLFATAEDLGRLLAAIVGDRPELDALRAELTEGKDTAAGWSSWGDGAWAKTGWTGTFVWFQPATKRWAVFLTNRTANGAEHGWVDFELVVDEAKR